MAMAGRGAAPGWQEEWLMGWSRIVARSWVEPGFRDEVLRADDGRLRELYRELGYEVPRDVELVVREVEDARAECRHSEHRFELTLPPPPPSELMAIALEDYVGDDVRSPPVCY
jgi:hypothetical protein